MEDTKMAILCLINEIYLHNFMSSKNIHLENI